MIVPERVCVSNVATNKMCDEAKEVSRSIAKLGGCEACAVNRIGFLHTQLCVGLCFSFQYISCGWTE